MKPYLIITLCAAGSLVIACGDDAAPANGTNTGATSSGGATGGGSNSGGATSGGSSSGAAANGGSGASGGATNGGGTTGGAPNGGTTTGGGATGGVPSGGAPNGGMASTATDFDCGADSTALPKLKLTSVVTGTEQPVFVASPAGDNDRLFVLELKTGRIRIIKQGVLLPTAYLDLGAKIEKRPNEQGLLGLAFHPNYANNGRFFVHYSKPVAGRNFGDTQVSEFSVSAANPDLADAASERPLLSVTQPANNHNGGSIEFGPDGFFYVALGDGGGSDDTYKNGQDPTTLLGSILRLDVDGAKAAGKEYGIPAGNLSSLIPSAAPELWNYGLRNPYRFSFDACKKDLYIGDVGQNRWEEINVEPFGSATSRATKRNYGWNILEAEKCRDQSTTCPIPADNVLPVASYGHTQQSCSVTGGYVYRGKAIPGLRGYYLYADFCSGSFWAFRAADVQLGGTNQPTFGVDISADLNPNGRAIKNISSFGQDNRGELYVTAFNGNVYRIEAE